MYFFQINISKILATAVGSTGKRHSFQGLKLKY